MHTYVACQCELIICSGVHNSSRVTCLGRNSTLVATVPGHLDVTILTPIGAPAILNQQ